MSLPPLLYTEIALGFYPIRSDPVTRLPHDVFLKIVHLTFPNNAQMRRFLFVSRRWFYALAPKVLRSFSFNPLVTPAIFDQYVQSYKWLFGKSPPPMECFDNRRNSNRSFPELEYRRSFLNVLQDSHIQVDTLKVEYVSPKEALQHFNTILPLLSTVKSLHIRFQKVSYSQEMHEVLAKCTHLQILSLSLNSAPVMACELPSEYDEGNKLPTLGELRLLGNPDTDFSKFTQLFFYYNTFPSLSTLELCNMSHKPKKRVTSLLKEVLSNSFGISIGNKCTLSKLVLVSDKPAQRALPDPECMASLTSFEVSLPDLSGKTLLQLLKTTHYKLTELKIGRNRIDFHTFPFQQLLALAPSLKSLAVSGFDDLACERLALALYETRSHTLGLSGRLEVNSKGVTSSGIQSLVDISQRVGLGQIELRS